MDQESVEGEVVDLPIHQNRIQVDIPEHGTFGCSGMTLDNMIRRYLPASPLDMQRIIKKELPEYDFSDVKDVSTLLIVLGDLHAPDYKDHGA